MRESSLFHRFLLKGSQIISDGQIIQSVKNITFNGNLDNISRTQEYLNFYLLYPEIKWAFLASMVSRNAGWNMCDLKGPTFPKMVNDKIRKRLFLTYERANWLIFQDAFPQLLLYHYSTIYNRPLFHLLKEFYVSKFMEQEWKIFYEKKDCIRLMISLIINEQNIIQQPIIKHPLYKKRIFSSLIFKFQELFHFSCVVFPTMNGELYGSSVVNFRKVDERIELGKRLSSILFNYDLFPKFLSFALNNKHTGSRNDYEQFLRLEKGAGTPYLREVYPIVKHHNRKHEDWSMKISINSEWLKMNNLDDLYEISEWFLQKQTQIQQLSRFMHFFV
ncbi:DUF2515 family protein [Heyndrickxia sp. NPDC080065]|uniref:DUF2515 family protein n=1 Tax=Heyndrickxia sp. NPDC080065 TaxID=3390568 RepID=UPI003D0922CC